jgi:hypothetical protein
MLCPNKRRITNKTSENTICLIPNEGGFGPAGSVAFESVVILELLSSRRVRKDELFEDQPAG